MENEEFVQRAARVVLAIQAFEYEQANGDFIAILNELPTALRDPPKNQGIAQKIIDQVCKKT